jgi:hypothetical protein
MSFNFGPHDFDCECARCESRRESNKRAWAALSESERNAALEQLADEFEETMLVEVAEGRAEIVGKSPQGRNLFRFSA